MVFLRRDGHTPLDLVKEGDQDVVDLLRGDSALLDAAKKVRDMVPGPMFGEKCGAVLEVIRFL